MAEKRSWPIPKFENRDDATEYLRSLTASLRDQGWHLRLSSAADDVSNGAVASDDVPPPHSSRLSVAGQPPSDSPLKLPATPIADQRWLQPAQLAAIASLSHTINRHMDLMNEIKSAVEALNKTLKESILLAPDTSTLLSSVRPLVVELHTPPAPPLPVDPAPGVAPPSQRTRTEKQPAKSRLRGFVSKYLRRRSSTDRESSSTTVTGPSCTTVTSPSCTTVTGPPCTTMTGPSCTTVTGPPCTTVTGPPCTTVTGPPCTTVTGPSSTTTLTAQTQQPAGVVGITVTARPTTLSLRTNLNDELSMRRQLLETEQRRRADRQRSE